MDLDLRAYARLLRKRKWIIIFALIVCVALAAFYTARKTPKYEASATLFVGQPQITVAQLPTGLAVTNLSNQLLKSYAEIITSRSNALAAIADSGIPVSPGVVRSGLTADPIVGTLVLKLNYIGTDPSLAQQIVNAVADTFVAQINAGNAGSKTAIPVRIIDRAVQPSAPISPNTTRNLTLAALLGLAGGVGLAFVIEHLDVTVKHREEIEHLGMHVLGTIPALDTHGEDVFLDRDTQGLGGEAFRKVRTAIGFLGVEAPIRTLLVTSPFAQEGKTTVSLNLAAAFALGGLRTLLVEADLRRPSLHKRFPTNSTNGLTTAIVGQVTVEEAISPTDTKNLSVMLAGAIPPNPVELLGSEQMAALLERLGRSFDVVIVDSPPVLPVADAATIMARTDGVLIVARTGKTDRRKLSESTALVSRAGGRFLGVVLNYQKPSEAPYEYSYYYSYRPVDPPGAETAGT
jgi:succinoglycan biosynthesis transport protein ExoP